MGGFDYGSSNRISNKIIHRGGAEDTEKISNMDEQDGQDEDRIE